MKTQFPIPQPKVMHHKKTYMVCTYTNTKHTAHHIHINLLLASRREVDTRRVDEKEEEDEVARWLCVGGPSINITKPAASETKTPQVAIHT